MPGQLQPNLRLPTHGGARAGAGRPKVKGSAVPHVQRPALASRHPLHVTLKALREVGSLRNHRAARAIGAALAAGCERLGVRVVHFTIQHDHVHLLVEAEGQRELSRGIQGLCIRMARGLNRALGRAGRVFADRFHARTLRTPTEVRNALTYVLGNHVKHAGPGTRIDNVDPLSSGAWFDGWRRRPRVPTPLFPRPVVTSARTWLLARGWRRLGAIELLARPAPAPSSSGAGRA